MTEIGFYILQDQAIGDRYRLACRIAEKAVRGGHRVVIHAVSTDQSKHLDSLLWTYNEQSFLPHGLIGRDDAGLNPILIGNAEQAPEEHDVLVNLALEVPTFFSRFQRLAECVDNDAAARAASRERYRFYRDRGYPLAIHEIR